MCEELAWGCTGISTTIMINNLAAIPIIVAGYEEQKKTWLSRMTDGELGAYAVTETRGRFHVAGMQHGDEKGHEYVIKGSKTFISNASHSQFFVVFAYTDKAAKYNAASAPSSSNAIGPVSASAKNSTSWDNALRTRPEITF